MTEKQQLDRFKEAAKQVDADQSDYALDKVMDKLDLKKKSDEKDGKGRGGTRTPDP